MKKTYASFIYLSLFSLLLSACASSTGSTSGSGTNTNTGTTSTGTSGAGGKAEDLSKYRPKFTVPPVTSGPSAAVTASIGAMPAGHINARVVAIMDTMAALNKSVRYAQGYRIQAYSGTERKAAMDMRTALVTRLPDEAVHLQYKQPTFRLKVGDYFTRTEAQQSLRRIRDLAPTATIVVDQINVK